MRADDLLFAILRQLNRLQETTQMTATRADLDSAIQLLLAAEATRDAAVSKAIADLAAKVQNGVVSSSSDFAAEVAQLQALQSNAATLTQTATAEDPGATNVTPSSNGTSEGAGLTVATPSVVPDLNTALGDTAVTGNSSVALVSAVDNTSAVSGATVSGAPGVTPSPK